MPRKKTDTLGRVSSLTELPHDILKAAARSGIERSERERSGTYFHINHSVVVSKINERFKGQIEIMDTKDALKKYDWLEDYYWRAVDKRKDGYTIKTGEKYSGGYFMRILPNAKVIFPLQSCLMISKENVEQRIHNIIIAEENSEARIISGCTSHPDVHSGQHIGISEFYIKKNATLNFTMIHNWAEEVTVRPRSAAIVEESGTFISNYVCLQPVKDIQMYPAAFCKGENSTARFNSILYASKNSLLDIGSKIELSGKNSRGEVISRAIARDNAKIIARGMLIGKNSPVKAHLECRGLLMNDDAEIHAIPELIGNKRDMDLSHEAAIGRIAEKEIVYLMSRGLTKDEATSVIIRGFLDVDIMGLPPVLRKEIKDLVDRMTEGM